MISYSLIQPSLSFLGWYIKTKTVLNVFKTTFYVPEAEDKGRPRCWTVNDVALLIGNKIILISSKGGRYNVGQSISTSAYPLRYLMVFYP